MGWISHDTERESFDIYMDFKIRDCCMLAISLV